MALISATQEKESKEGGKVGLFHDIIGCRIAVS